jgi:hypothetical protein
MMTAEDSIHAAAHAFEKMTDEEAFAWLAAGDYTSVAGIPLPEKATRKFAELAASGSEVEGFDFGMNLGPGINLTAGSVPPPSPTGSASPDFKHCCNGAHYAKVLLG